MHDPKIRAALKAELRKTPGVIVDEFGVGMGSCVVDVLHAGPNALEAYEIKSAEDTLRRLPGQVAEYACAFEAVTLVAEGRNLDHAWEIVPEWWGVWEAVEVGEGVSFALRREGKPNPTLTLTHWAQRLWKDEAQALLRDLGVSKGLWRPAPDLHAKLVEVAGAALPAIVRRQVCLRLLLEQGRTKRKNAAEAA